MNETTPARIHHQHPDYRATTANALKQVEAGIPVRAAARQAGLSVATLRNLVNRTIARGLASSDFADEAMRLLRGRLQAAGVQQDATASLAELHEILERATAAQRAGGSHGGRVSGKARRENRHLVSDNPLPGLGIVPQQYLVPVPRAWRHR